MDLLLLYNVRKETSVCISGTVLDEACETHTLALQDITLSEHVRKRDTKTWIARYGSAKQHLFTANCASSD